MFLNPSLTLNTKISEVILTTENNELYENGTRVANQTDIDFLQLEINSLTPDNPNGWVNSGGITSTIQQIPFSDGNPNGLITSQSLTFGIDPQNNPTLTVGGTQMISVNNNMYLRSAGEIFTNMDLKLEGDPNFQRALQIKNMSQPNYVKTYVDNTTSDFITDNEIGSKNEWIGATGYYFDNSIYVNGTELIPGNPNALITDQPLITPSAGAIILSDGITPFGTNTDNNLSYDVVSGAPTLTIGGAKISSANNNMVLQSTDYILTNKDIYLQGTADVQRYLTIGLNNVVDNVKSFVDINTQDYICRNELLSRTQFKLASEYTFDSDVKIGATGQSKKLYVNDIEIKPPVQFLNNYYVSPSGTDADGDGSIYNPWGTIGHAIFVLSAIVGDIQATINISAGTYTENLTINKSGIALVGASSNLPNLTIINGNITFDMNAGSGLFSVGGLENIQLNGILEHRQTNIYTNALNVINCLFFAQSGKSAIITFGNGGGLLGSLTVQASLIYMSDAIAVAIDNTAISMINTQLTNSPLLAVSPTSFITVSGAGRINLFGCSIFQGSTVSTVDPLVLVNNSSTVTSSSTINSCILVYTSSTSDAGTGNKACIKFSGSAAMNTHTLVYNYFRAVGAQTGSPQNQCVQKTGTAQLALIIGNNVAASAAYHVAPASGSYTKTLLTDVV
jgi:hypothetical protein